MTRRLGKSFQSAFELEAPIRRELGLVYKRMLPYGGSFYDTTTQTNAGATSENLMSLNTVVMSDGVELESGTKLRFKFPGWFMVTFSAQFEKASGNSAEVDVWLKENGTNVDHSNTVLTLAGSSAKVVAAWDWAVYAKVDDYVELAWSSAATDMRILSRAAQTGPTRPAVPSVIVNVVPIFGGPQ